MAEDEDKEKTTEYVDDLMKEIQDLVEKLTGELMENGGISQFAMNLRFKYADTGEHGFIQAGSDPKNMDEKIKEMVYGD